MKKKTYIQPTMKAVALRGPRMMISGSETLNSYDKGNDIMIGDTDDK